MDLPSQDYREVIEGSAVGVRSREVEAASSTGPNGQYNLWHRVRFLAVSLRPYQWIKNLLVFSGLVFSRSLLHLEAVLLSVGAFSVFCLAASATYLFNDLRDIDSDRNHPAKRLRPVAAGLVSPGVGAATALVFAALATVSGYLLGMAFGAVVSAYLLLNLLYNLGLKKIVILDAMIVASGYVLRAVGGAFAVRVAPSPWLILCTLFLALLVSFGKRRHELVTLRAGSADHRSSLGDYSTHFLDLMMATSGGGAIVTYALYTMSGETVARFGSRAMVLTVPVVLYALFRYFYLVHQELQGGDPARLMLKDLPMLTAGVVWILVVCLVVYGPFRWFSF